MQHHAAHCQPTMITPDNRAELFRQIFEVDKRGGAIFDDLARRFSQPAVTTGGIDAIIETYKRAGQHEVIQYILLQINRANGATESPTTEIPHA